MKDKIDFSYDSHVHFFGVGIPAVQWRIQEDDTELNLPEHLLDQQLIKGFGWSDKLPLSEFKKLTDHYPDKDFCLSYFDGHSSFISKNLVERISYKSTDHKDLETGIIVNEVERDKILKHLPAESDVELRKMALYAQDVFLKNGFTRVRHLTARADHWTCLKKLETEGLLKLKVEMFFSEFMGQSLEEAITSFKDLKKQSSEKVLASGIKIFYDGSFGSQTAFTSLPETVLPRCSKEEVREKIKMVFDKAQAPVAVHSIGDRALEDIISIYAELDHSQTWPTVHLEHAPIFSHKALKILKKQKLSCVFHFQPSHWIHDRKWYAEYGDKIQEHKIYPFDFLSKHGYSYHFGSDAPVVECSKDKTLTGLQMIKADQKRRTSA